MVDPAPRRTPGGSLVREYDPDVRAEIAAATVGFGWRAALERHLELLLGASGVHADDPNADPPVDVLAFGPGSAREFVTLVTVGASTRPMASPAYDLERRHQELLIYVPPAPAAGNGAGEGDAPPRWALDLLRRLGRFAHEQRTFLGPGHTVAFTNPATPFAERSLLAAVLLTPPIFEESALDRLAIDGEPVRFLNVVPITAAELDVKLERGLDALYDLLAENDLHQVVDVHRACLATGETPPEPVPPKRGRFRRRTRSS
jgi:hypothetical protein